MAWVPEHSVSGGGDMSTATWDPDSNGAIDIAKGGTNATTAAAALTNLGAAPVSSPAFTGPIQQSTPAANSGGGLVQKVVEAVSAALSGASGTITLSIPAGDRIRGVQLRVDTAITTDSAATWSAAYTNTATTAICSGQLLAKNTAFNAIHPAYEITTGTVAITLTPASGNFTGGVVRAIVYYEELTAMSAAP